MKPGAIRHGTMTLALGLTTGVIGCFLPPGVAAPVIIAFSITYALFSAFASDDSTQ